MTIAKIVQYNGKSYRWTGKIWQDSSNFTSPPTNIVRRLNFLLAQEIQTDIASITSLEILLTEADNSFDTNLDDLALLYIRQALKQNPTHLGARAKLSKVLRNKGQPQQALHETDAFKRESYAPLITSRAAALCDLHRWEEAKREIARVLAMGGSEAAWSVYYRIKAACPDLFL